MDLRDVNHKDLDSRRLFAVLLDLLLFAPVEFVAFQYDFGAVVLAMALWLIYFFLCDVTTGQTLGKAVFGLRTVTVEGQLPSARAASSRTILRLVDHGIVGLVTLVATGAKRQRLGDLAAGTVVVRASEVRPLPRTLSRTVWLWPALWLAPALVVFWLSAEGRMSGTYRAAADAICAEALVAGSSVQSADELILLYNAQLNALRSLDPPPNWQPRHEALLSVGESVTLAANTVLTSAARSKHPEKLIAREWPKVEAANETGNARLADMGFEDCAQSS
jgi:uncharacterized RDD family membrane protein YckC